MNTINFSGSDINLGYTASHKIDKDLRCMCHDIFGMDRRAYRYRDLLTPDSTQFKLGTIDWVNSKVTQSAGVSAYGSGDDGAEEVIKIEDSTEPDESTTTEGTQT